MTSTNGPSSFTAVADIQDEREVRIRTPRVFYPLLNPSRYKGAYGGRGSGKSHFFAEALVERCLIKKTRAVCVREVQRSLGMSSKLLIEDKIRKWQLEDSFRLMNNCTHTPNGGIIIYNGMQDHTAESIKSLEGFDVAWVEEAQALSSRSLELLRPTIRAAGSELWFSWNPRYDTDPVDKLFRGTELPPDAVLVKANFKDNPWFPEELRREMEWDRRRDYEKYQHVWEGMYEQNAETRVFKNFVVDQFETPKDAQFYHGSDWGFSIDPSLLVRLYFSPPRKIFIDREVYKIGCEIDDLPALFDKLDPDDPGGAREWKCLADGSRPETISYMQRHGYPNLTAAKKGPGSVKEGIKFLQGYDIVIHERCVHTADEFKAYSFKTDRMTGEPIPVFEEKKNHVIDAVRYATEPIRGIGDWCTW